MAELHMLKDRVDLLNYIKELEEQLKDYKKLQSEVHKDIERVWSIDSYDYSHNPYDIKERKEIIERVFYKVANEWLDGDNLQPLAK